jgi:hypothetical protein
VLFQYESRKDVLPLKLLVSNFILSTFLMLESVDRRLVQSTLIAWYWQNAFICLCLFVCLLLSRSTLSFLFLSVTITLFFSFLLSLLSLSFLIYFIFPSLYRSFVFFFTSSLPPFFLTFLLVFFHSFYSSFISLFWHSFSPSEYAVSLTSQFDRNIYLLNAWCITFMYNLYNEAISSSGYKRPVIERFNNKKS